jgi:hypothetical protein
MNNYLDDNDFLSPKVTQHSGHMIMTNVNKPTKIKYFNIDTRFQEEYNLVKKANFQYTLPQRITNVKSIAVRTVEIPISFYPFSQNRGNTFFQVNNISIVIPDGNYSSTSLVTAINTQLNNKVSPTLQIISINSDNNIITLENSDTNNNYDINFVVDASGNFNRYPFKASLGWCLGFRQPSYTITGRESINTESILDVNNIRYLFLVVDEYRQSNPNSFVSALPNSFLSKNVLARISLSPSIFSFGSVIVANTFNGLLLSDQRMYSGNVDLQKLNIQLVDEWGNLVDLNQLDFSFCLEIEYE